MQFIAAKINHAILQVRIWFGYREWRTMQEFSHPVTVHQINGEKSERACQWRDQVCPVSHRVRRQSNFGSGWATEYEEKFPGEHEELWPSEQEEPTDANAH